MTPDPVTTPRVDLPGPSRAVPVAVVLGCVVLVALLGAGVATAWPPQLSLDTAVSRVMYAGDARPPLVSGLLETLTAPGLSWVRWLVFLPVVALLVARRRWVSAAWVVVAVGGVGVLNSGLKELVGRVRPGFVEGGARYGSLSFPSGHSAGIACLVTTALVLGWPRLASTARRWWTLGGVALVLVVGCTRMWLGVHYLSDVLAGWAVGLGWTALVVLAARAAGGREVSWTA